MSFLGRAQTRALKTIAFGRGEAMLSALLQSCALCTDTF